MCGPDLTSPGTGNVSGTWHADGPAAGLSDITMVLHQTSDAAVTGTFTAFGTLGQQVCPKLVRCTLSSTITGANTVLQVNLLLKDSGIFTGQLVTVDELRGTMSWQTRALIDFQRVP
jgi:hypothetical protein